MKLVRFSTNGQHPRLGAIQGDRIADLQASLAATLTRRGVVRAAEIAAALVPTSARAFLEGGAAAEEAIAGIKEWVTVPAASARLHAPIVDPDTLINDVSARDFQFIGSQWMAGKIPETFAPVGPYIADRSEVPDPHVLELRLWVNGKQMQNGNTKTFIFDVRYLVSYLSNLMTLAPGDLIATGTPPGVGFAKKPPVFLQPGDVVTMEITGLGRLENSVKEA